MGLSGFFTSFPGMYVAQSVSHALIAAIVVDAALRAWRIDDPAIRQRFRLLVLAVALFSVPLYQFIAPDRASLSFRLTALFDSARWLHMDLWAGVAGWMLLALLLAFTTAVFIGQELIPIARHALGSGDRRGATAGTLPADPRVMRALESLLLSGKPPEVRLIDDDDYLLFSTTGRKAAIFLSVPFARALTDEELRAALAHEMGHVERSRRPFLVLVFLLRVLLFWNPVVLMEFRRVVQEEEKICDDVSVRLAGSASAMAEVLRKFTGAGSLHHEHGGAGGASLRDRLEDYSHSILMESRLARLDGREERRVAGAWFSFTVTAGAILGITYFVV